MCRNKYNVKKRHFYEASTADNEWPVIFTEKDQEINQNEKESKPSQYNKTQNKKATMKLSGFTMNILTENSMS